MSKKKMSSNLKRDLSIGRQNSRNIAMEFVPDELKGTEEGFKVWQEYKDKFFKEYAEWRINKLE
ncbi:MAG: hypothetical protein ACOC5T_07520 [Elusimicrobiota bacterium]